MLEDGRKIKYNRAKCVYPRACLRVCVREKDRDGLLRRAHPVRGLLFIIVNAESIKPS